MSALAAETLTMRDLRRIARPRPRIPLEIAVASGYELIDRAGRRYFDFTSGWNVANAGWSHPRIVKKVAATLGSLAFAPSWCTFENKVVLAEAIAERLAGDWKTYCCVSGTEAVESAIKIAKRATGRHGIVTLAQSYHGSTLGSMLASGIPRMASKDLPDSDVYRVLPLPDPRDPGLNAFLPQIRAVLLKEPVAAAVLLEPLFTNQGAILPDERFLVEIQRQCRLCGALLIVDEVGTGFARTGKLFGFQHLPLQPDIIAVAKGFSSGVVPIGAAIIKSEIAHAVHGPGFNSTYAWTPPACAAALEMLKVIDDEDLNAQAAFKGGLMKAALESQLTGRRGVAAIRGLGLEMAIELVGLEGSPLPYAVMERLLNALRLEGLFVESSAHTSSLLLMPPLNVPGSKLLEATGRLLRVLMNFLPVENARAQLPFRIGPQNQKTKNENHRHRTKIA